MNCPGCGASITDDSLFCKYCGTKLPETVKEDKKRREFRLEFNNENSVRRAEIKKERERQKQEHELKMQEKQREIEAQKAKRDKQTYIAMGILFLVAICLLMSLR